METSFKKARPPSVPGSRMPSTRDHKPTSKPASRRPSTQRASRQAIGASLRKEKARHRSPLEGAEASRGSTPRQGKQAKESSHTPCPSARPQQQRRRTPPKSAIFLSLTTNLTAARQHEAAEKTRLLLAPPTLPSTMQIMNEKAAENEARKMRVQDYKATGSTASELQKGGYTASELKVAGFTLDECWDAGFSVPALRGAGFSPRTIKDKSKMAKRQAVTKSMIQQQATSSIGTGGSEFHHVGSVMSRKLLDAKPPELAGRRDEMAMRASSHGQGLGGAHTSATINGSRLSFGSKLDSAEGANAVDPAKTAYGVAHHEASLAMNLAAARQHEAAEKTRLLLAPPTLPSTMQVINAKAAENEARQMRVQEYKETGSTASELQKDGYTASELKVAGFTLDECWDAGFSVPALRGAGFSPRTIKDKSRMAKRAAVNRAFQLQNGKPPGIAGRRDATGKLSSSPGLNRAPFPPYATAAAARHAALSMGFELGVAEHASTGGLAQPQQEPQQEPQLDPLPEAQAQQEPEAESLHALDPLLALEPTTDPEQDVLFTKGVEADINHDKFSMSRLMMGITGFGRPWSPAYPLRAS